MIPRIVISSLSSAAGKTTVTAGLCELLRGRGMRVAALKAGPDFIDPLFHEQVVGALRGNIDLYFTGEEEARRIFCDDTRGADVAVVEGAMGLFDGVGGNTARASAFHVARALGSSVLLVVDAKKKSLSAAAEIAGALALSEKLSGDFPARGPLRFFALLNRCSAPLFARLKPKIEELCGVPVVGFLESDGAFSVASRHLGLVTPDAVLGVKEKIAAIARSLQRNLDVGLLFGQGGFPAPGERPRPGRTEPPCSPPPFRRVTGIAVARDEAFCFYYRENLALLERFGAELLFFSPLRNEPVPREARALYIGGGYPELFWRELSEAARAAASVRAVCRSGLPVFAECGGFLYLKLLGVLAGTFRDEGRLVRFGYAEFECRENNFLLRKGEKIRGHEFHHFDTSENGRAFIARKPGPLGAEWECVQLSSAVDAAEKPCRLKSAAFGKNIVAGFPHFYFPSNPVVAERLVDAALVYDSLFGDCAPCRRAREGP